MNRLLLAAIVAAISFPLVTPTIAEPIFINTGDADKKTAVFSTVLDIEKRLRDPAPIVLTQRTEIVPPHNLNNDLSIFRNAIPSLSDPPPIAILDKPFSASLARETESVEISEPVCYVGYRSKRRTSVSRRALPNSRRSSARVSARKTVARKAAVQKSASRRTHLKKVVARVPSRRIASRQSSVRKIETRKISSRNIAVRRVTSGKIAARTPAVRRIASRQPLSSKAKARRIGTTNSSRKNAAQIALRKFPSKRIAYYAASRRHQQSATTCSILKPQRQEIRKHQITGLQRPAVGNQNKATRANSVVDQSIKITAINEKPHIISIAKQESAKLPAQNLTQERSPALPYTPSWTLPSHQQLLSTQKQILAPKEERLASHEYLLKPQQQLPLAQRRYLSVQSNLLRTQPVKKKVAKSHLNTLALLPLRTLATLIAPCPVATALTISPIFESLFDVKTLKSQIAQERLKKQRLAHAKTVAKWKASNRRNMRMKIASNALNTAKQLNTVGYCYRGVTLALKPLGINLSGMAAYMAKEQLDADPRFQKVQIAEIAELHPGDVLVHGPSRSHPYGHIGVYLGNENEASDHVQKTFLKGPYSGVTVFRYEPTNTEAYSALGMDSISLEKSSS